MSAPRRANSRAIALPTRCAPPVTSATFSVKSTRMATFQSKVISTKGRDSSCPYFSLLISSRDNHQKEGRNHHHDYRYDERDGKNPAVSFQMHIKPHDQSGFKQCDQQQKRNRQKAVR